MLSTTFILGSYLGYKIFKMEKDTAILTASGASVCGAAAVLATEPVLKAEGHKTAIAVSMVVLFGTIPRPATAAGERLTETITKMEKLKADAKYAEVIALGKGILSSSSSVTSSFSRQPISRPCVLRKYI